MGFAARRLLCINQKNALVDPVRAIKTFRPQEAPFERFFKVPVRTYKVNLLK
jgi:hypothetical protein